jgi:hypothetical protein
MEKLIELKEGILSHTNYVYSGIIEFLPKFLTALVIGLIGYFIAVTLDK